jgi:hypothetical protein
MYTIVSNMASNADETTTTRGEAVANQAGNSVSINNPNYEGGAGDSDDGGFRENNQLNQPARSLTNNSESVRQRATAARDGEAHTHRNRNSRAEHIEQLEHQQQEEQESI